MRDIVLTAFVLGSLPFILRRPQLGVLMYVWISVMNPHRLTWSFAYDFQFAQYVAIATLAGALFSKDLRWPAVNGLTVALISFAVWTGVTTVFAFYPSESFQLWQTLVKTLLMSLLIPMLFQRKEDIRALLWVIVISIGFYGTKGGLWTVTTGGVARVYGPLGSYIEDNNSIAIALVMTIPLMRHLQLSTASKSLRWGLGAMMLLCGIAALGTYSRGALLAVGAMCTFLWWKGRHKLAVLLAVASVLPLAFAFMPQKWHERMDTIVNYHEESSAHMRLNSWGTMWNLAKARPLVGGGFHVASAQVYERYSPDPNFPPQVAHSIYLQALGEHGFVGFALYVIILGMLWRKAGSVAQMVRKRPDLELAWARDLSLMVQVSLVGFGVGGAFLSLVNFDVPYYLVGIMIATVAIVERELASSGGRSTGEANARVALSDAAPALPTR